MPEFDPDLEVTPASSWRTPRREGMIITLPSGNKARVRRTLSLMSMIANDTLPNPLLKHVDEMLKKAGENRPLKEVVQDTDGQIALEFSEMETDAMSSLIDLIEQEITEIFINPKVYKVPEGENPNTWTPEDPNGVSTMDIEWNDKVFAYSFAQGAPLEMVRFPEASANVAAGSDGGEVPSAAEQPAAAG